MKSQFNDDVLIQKVLDGDTNLFGELINKYQDFIYGLAYSKIKDITDAQDITQDVFIKAYRKLDQLEKPEKFIQWLRAITVNECLNCLQRRKLTVPFDEEDLQDSLTAQAKAEFQKQEFNADVLRSVDALSENHRMVVTLHYLSGLSYEEIGASLGVPVATVVGRLDRARKQLRADLMDDIEKAMTSRRLPETFTEDVVKRLTLCPIEPGRVQAKILGNEGILVLGIPSGRSHMLLLAMLREDMDLILSYTIKNKVINPKLQTVMAMKDVMDTFNIKANEVILYLDKEQSCHARMSVIQHRIEKSLCLNVRDALYFAFKIGVPVLAEGNLVNKGIAGIDGGSYKILNSVRDFRSSLSVMNQCSRLESAAFKAAPLTIRGKHSVSCHAELAMGWLLLRIHTTEITVKLSLDDYLLGFERLCNITEEDKMHSWLEDDDNNLFKITYLNNDGEITICFSPHLGAPEW